MNHQPHDTTNRNHWSRRRTLKSAATVVGVTAVTKWSKPIIESAILPAHAQTTNDGGDVPAPEIVFELIQESGQNADNQANNRPYITYVINGDEVQFEFFNPTNFSFAFDYRVDQEPGTTINGLSEIVISQGELAGEMIGDVYNLTSVPANSSVMVMVTGTSEIRAGLRVGAEQEWYLDWIIFQAIQVTIP